MVVIGAGAAGLFCAGIAGQRGLRVLLIDHSEKVAEKIRISGGGRCNFTNRDAGAGELPLREPALLPLGAGALHAARLHRAGAAPRHRLPREAQGPAVLRRLGRGHHRDAAARMRRRRRRRAGSRARCSAVRARRGSGFELDTDRGPVRAPQLVIATGGLSIPKIGATDFGYRSRSQFGLRIVPTAPGAGAADLRRRRSGRPSRRWPACRCAVRDRDRRRQGRSGRFVEDLLFTHRGLSGPAVLQISSYWRAGHAAAHRPGAGPRPAGRAAAGQAQLAAPARQRARRAAAARAWPTPGWPAARTGRPADGRAARPATCATLARQAAALGAGARRAPRATARPR